MRLILLLCAFFTTLNVSAETNPTPWHTRDGVQCRADSGGPSRMINYAKTLGLPFATKDVKEYSAIQEVTVTIQGVRSVTYYNGLQRCEKSLTKAEKELADHQNRYR